MLRIPVNWWTRAWELGYAALAITDECSVAGVVRAYAALQDMNLPKEDPFKLILGSEFHFDGFRLVALAHNAAGWGNLCEFITAARREAKKGEYIVSRHHSDFSMLDECEILVAPVREGTDAIDTGDAEALQAIAAWAKNLFGERTWLAAELTLGLDDALWLDTLRRVSVASGVPVVAAAMSTCT